MSISRRPLLLLGFSSLAVGPRAWAHHGWSSFDQERPLYLEGRVLRSRWQNPHAELVIEVPAGLKLPTDLAQRALPAQSAPVDGAGLLARAALPRRADRQWTLELAPLTRIDAWKIPEPRPGAEVAAVGFAFKEEKGEPLMRVEYLFAGGKAYGLRSGPA